MNIFKFIFCGYLLCVSFSCKKKADDGLIKQSQAKLIQQEIFEEELQKLVDDLYAYKINFVGTHGESYYDSETLEKIDFDLKF